MKYTIIAVDDNRLVLTIIKLAFAAESDKYTIYTAENGKIALEIIEQHIPDVILLDMDMPVMDGMETLRYLRNDERYINIPVIMITDTKNLQEAFEAGATDFIHKPLDKIELKARVKSTLSLYKLINGIIKQSEELEAQSAELEKQRQRAELERQKADELRQIAEKEKQKADELRRIAEEEKQRAEEQKQQVEEQKALLEKQKKQIEDEKKKSDLLLLNILPYEVAEQLKNKGMVQAKHYRRVTVLFTDFKGFTKLAEQLSFEEIIRELGVCFEKFDEITEKLFIEKIKTIGDAYMCVGGVPMRNKSNPIDVTLAGLRIQKFMDDYNKMKKALGQPQWQLRIGIHTGEVVAGVIGKKKFAYDIWGDTVNTASRMETGGEVGRVNISGSTHELIKDYFICTFRGKIQAKNKGEIDMYFVEGLKPEFCQNGDSTQPNQTFMEIYSSI